MLVRVYKTVNGELSIVHPNEGIRMSGETDQELLDRVCINLPEQKAGLDYKDIQSDQLPSREERSKWRMNSGGVVQVDNTIITDNDKRKDIEKRLEAEINKPAPDYRSIVVMQEQLRKKDYAGT